MEYTTTTNTIVPCTFLCRSRQDAKILVPGAITQIMVFRAIELKSLLSIQLAF